MKTMLGDGKTVRDGIVHYLLADVLFAAFLGASVEFIILFFFRHNALAAFQGIGGLGFDSVITWCAVLLSVRLMRRTRQNDSLGVALVSTVCAMIVSLSALPYLHFFSLLSHVPMIYLVIKEALHLCVFYTASIIYFSGYSARSLLKERSSSLS